MRTIRLALLGLAIAGLQLTAFAGDPGKTLPPKIAASFSAKYPGVKVKDWKFREDAYVVNFENNNRKCQAYYSTAGDWMRTETRLPWKKDLPKAVRDGLVNSPYGVSYVDDIKEVNEASGKTLYLLRVDRPSRGEEVPEHAERDYVLYFTPDGTLIKKINYQKEVVKE